MNALQRECLLMMTNAIRAGALERAERMHFSCWCAERAREVEPVPVRDTWRVSPLDWQRYLSVHQRCMGDLVSGVLPQKDILANYRRLLWRQ